jgi:1,4-dihydroxy-2-naphthoyl-CoA hydrolase
MEFKAKISPGLEGKVAWLASRAAHTLGHTLGITYEELDRERVVATLPVDDRTRQPFGLLHGGASVALAESLCSVGAWLNVDETSFDVVGIEINANHLRAVRDGIVRGTAVPIHRGRSTHVWETRIVTPDGAPVSVSRCTLAVVTRSRS